MTSTSSGTGRSADDPSGRDREEPTDPGAARPTTVPTPLRALRPRSAIDPVTEPVIEPVSGAHPSAAEGPGHQGAGPDPSDADPELATATTTELPVPAPAGARDADDARGSDRVGTDRSDAQEFGPGEFGPGEFGPGEFGPDRFAGDGPEQEYQGPLERDAVRRVAEATTAVIVTGDRYGERDVAVLTGPRCVVRVLDGHHLAVPDVGVEPSALRSNLAEAPRIGALLVGPGGPGARRALHLNGTAEAVPAETLRQAHPDLPVDPVPGRACEVWVVVTVGDVYPLDGDDVPPLGPTGAPAPAPATSAPRGSRGRVPVLAAAVAVLLLGLVALGVTAVSLAGNGPAPAAAPPPTAAPGPTGPATLYGRVSDVPSPATVVVDVGGTPVTAGVVGIDDAAVPGCARAASLAFARSTLAGHTVTLVPDPTLAPSPTLPPTGGTRAYVVLDTQLSYTDAAIGAGAAPASGPAQYRAVFDREQQRAREEGLGMWGPPCIP